MHSVGVSTIDRVRAFPAGEQIKEVGKGVSDGFGTEVPAGGEDVPLGESIGDVEDSEEAFAQVAATEGDSLCVFDSIVYRSEDWIIYLRDKPVIRTAAEMRTVRSERRLVLE